MIPKPISPTDLRQHLYSVVREVASGKAQYLVTPGEGDGVVLLSREEYNAIVAERELLRDLRDAEADLAAGRTFTSAEVRTALARRSSRKGKRSRRG